MKITVYGHGWLKNFGDELMIIVAASYIKYLRGDVMVYGLGEEIASKYGLATAISLEACVIAGGAFLSHHSSKRVFDNSEELRRHLVQRQIPVMGLSISDDNSNDGLNLSMSSAAILMMRNFKGVIRTPNDFEYLHKSGIDVRFADDIFWALFYVIPGNDQKANKVCVEKDSIKTPLHRFILNFAFKLRGLIVVYYDTINPSLLSHNLKITKKDILYHDPFDLAIQFKKSSLVVTSKLHPGLCAMTPGTPSLCARPNIKSVGFYTYIKAMYRTCSGLSAVERLFFKILFRKKVWRPLEKSFLQARIESSLLNFHFVRDFLPPFLKLSNLNQKAFDDELKIFFRNLSTIIAQTSATEIKVDD